MKKRLFVLFSALVLMLSLMAVIPASALAGRGYKSDPFIITTYEELQKAMKFGYTGWVDYDVYYKLGNDIIVTDSLNDNELVVEKPTNFSSAVYSIHIDLAGHTLKRKPKSIDNYLFENKTRCELVIDDSVGNGEIIFEPYYTTTYGKIFGVWGNGELTINNGIFRLNHSTKTSNDSVVSNFGGTVTINGGEFHCSYCDVSHNQGSTTINGGKFYNTSVNHGTYSGGGLFGYFVVPDYLPIALCARYDTNYTINACELIGEDGATTGIGLHTNQGNNIGVKDKNVYDYIGKESIVTIEGKDEKDNEVDNSRIIGKHIIISKPKTIDFVEFTVTEPVAGKSPEYATVKTEGVTRVSQTWVHGDYSNMASGEIFEAGKEYIISIVVKPQTGYKFADTITAKANGKTMSVSKDTNDLQKWYCYIKYTATGASTRKKGDVAKNDKIDNADLLAVKSHIKKIKTLTGEDLWAADVDGNGAVNNTDLIAMKAHIKGVKKLW